MFGRLLSDQVEADNRDVPVIVEKSVEAVEKNGVDFEGTGFDSKNSCSLLFLVTETDNFWAGALDVVVVCVA